ncbi:MAG: DUF5050 domain-containing protein [bacterium]|nr:DUF5050 domain-containing protein [bacterium]
MKNISKSFFFLILFLLLIPGCKYNENFLAGLIEPDRESSIITISSPAEGSIFKKENIIVPITGIADDNIELSEVSVAIDNGSFSPARGKDNWLYNINTDELAYGRHTVIAKATDLYGNTSYAQTFIVITYDSNPDINSTIPAHKEANVPLNQEISILFTNDMEADSINDNTFIVEDSESNTMSGEISYYPNEKKAVFRNNEDWIIDTTYTVTVTTGAKDFVWNFFTSDYSFTFYTHAEIPVEPVSVTGVGLNKSSTSLTENDSEQLTATIFPEGATNKNVTWSSTDGTKASVSSTGLVKAIAQGSATIRATTEDGGHVANCVVTVNNNTTSLIVFASDRDDRYEYEIYVMNTDGSNQKRLTDTDSNDWYPSWSPDGSQIVFTSKRDGGYGEIYVMNVDGSNPTRLTDNNVMDRSPSWSPDGSQIAFHSGSFTEFEIYVMDTDGENRTSITNSSGDDSFPCWSPDGSQIAFQSKRDGNYEIYVMNANGSNQTNITNNSDGNDCCPSWSPDGSQIAFQSNRDGIDEVYVMDADGSNQRNITNDPVRGGYGPSWSPGGSQIAFTSNRGFGDEIYVMNADGSNQTNVTNNSGTDYEASWSPFIVE